MVQYSFTSTETRRLVKTDRDVLTYFEGFVRSPRVFHSVATLQFVARPDMVDTFRAFRAEYYLLHSDWLELLGAVGVELGAEPSSRDGDQYHGLVYER